jgi:hypothetical protein
MHPTAPVTCIESIQQLQETTVPRTLVARRAPAVAQQCDTNNLATRLEQVSRHRHEKTTMWLQLTEAVSSVVANTSGRTTRATFNELLQHGNHRFQRTSQSQRGLCETTDMPVSAHTKPLATTTHTLADRTAHYPSNQTKHGSTEFIVRIRPN